MPYIDKERRAEIDGGDTPNTVGELTYAFTRTARLYLWQRSERFSTHAEIIAALECTKQEYYRRVLGQYENEKIEVNGDVFE